MCTGTESLFFDSLKKTMWQFYCEHSRLKEHSHSFHQFNIRPYLQQDATHADHQELGRHNMWGRKFKSDTMRADKKN